MSTAGFTVLSVLHAPSWVAASWGFNLGISIALAMEKIRV